MFGDSREITYLKKLDNKLTEIEVKISEINDGIRRNDTHISFISRVYLIFSKPLNDFLNYFKNDLQINNQPILETIQEDEEWGDSKQV